MKSGNIPIDDRSPEPIPTTVAVVKSRNLLHMSSSIGDEDLDLEVSRFLESDFFADHGYALASLRQPSASNLQEEHLHMDIDESFDMPDLDFGDLSEALGDSSEPHLSPAPTSSMAVQEPIGSLRVYIPASALFGPPPTAEPRESALRKKTPRSTSTTRSRRRKAEVEYLRQQVQDFEDKLDQLRRESLSGGGGSSPPSGSSPSSLKVIDSSLMEPPPSQSPRWERVAKSQKTEKQKSETENAKLKKMLESQLKVAKSLSNILRKQQEFVWLKTSHPEQTKKNLCSEEPEDVDSRFEVLEAQVEALYTQLDAVLDQIGAMGPDMEGHSEQVKTDESGTIFMEVVDSTAMPFDVHTIGAAIWKLMSASSLSFGNRQYQIIDVLDDTIRAQVSLGLKLQRHETSIRMWVIGKRVIADADRIVFVWSAMGDTECSLFGKYRIKIRESAWTVITGGPRSENGDSEEGNTDNQDQREPVTTVQNVVRMTPELQVSGGTSNVSEDHVGVLTDVVLSSFRRNLATMEQMIENIILSDIVTARANE